MTTYEILSYWGAGFLLAAALILIAIEVFYD